MEFLSLLEFLNIVGGLIDLCVLLYDIVVYMQKGRRARFAFRMYVLYFFVCAAALKLIMNHYGTSISEVSFLKLILFPSFYAFFLTAFTISIKNMKARSRLEERKARNKRDKNL